jgi:hypothetical protein
VSRVVPVLTTVFRGVKITGRTKGGNVNETVDGVTSPLDAGWFTTRSSTEEIDLLPGVKWRDVLKTVTIVFQKTL